MNCKKIFDKSSWKSGPWQTESDFVAWIDEKTNLAIIMRRNEFGCWCGFVGVDQSHSMFLLKLQEEDNIIKDVEIHKGIGFSGFLHQADLEFTPPNRKWWFGFNCSSEGDYCPRKKTQSKKGVSVKSYRTEKYVYDEATKLAKYLYEKK